MRKIYIVLAYAVAAEVVVQAAAVAYGFFGLGHWVDGGGVLTGASIESDDLSFPGLGGLAVHGLNGSLIVPVIGLLLLVSSFFARVPHGIRFAGAVFGLVLVQVFLGFFAHEVPALGGLHGINALLLFSAAVVTARRAQAQPDEPAAAAARVSASA